MTSDRLSLTVCAPAAASSRASDTELAGIHSAGPLTEFGRPFADEAVDDLIGIGGLDPHFHAAVSDGRRAPVVGFGQLPDLIGDRGIGDHGDGEFAVHAAGGGRVGAMGQRVAEESPQDEPADHHHDGDQRGDHADADAAPAGRHRTVAARPFATFPFTGVLRSRRPWRGGGPATAPRLRLRVVLVGFGIVGVGIVRLVVIGFAVSGSS